MAIRRLFSKGPSTQGSVSKAGSLVLAMWDRWGSGMFSRRAIIFPFSVDKRSNTAIRNGSRNGFFKEIMHLKYCRQEQ
jgi:hypothetical protein